MKNEKENTKRMLILIGTIIVLILALNLASAYKNLCLNYGQVIPSPQDPRYTCRHDQCINICVTDNNYPTNPDFCNDVGACQFLDGGTGEVDGDAPILTVNSPLEGIIYNSRKVLFDLEFDEPSTIYYLDNVNGRDSWKRICSNCDDIYSKSISLRDGENNISIKATDRNGNSAIVTRTFFVDSNKPKINKVLPSGDFATGLFEVEYSEVNLKSVELTYGNLLSGYRTVNLSGCSSGSKVWCGINVSLNDYDGERIDYNFKITDIANTFRESKKKSLDVDTTYPILNNPSSFWHQGTGDKDKEVHFIFNITESNFDSISYIDHSDSRPKWKSLCNNLKDGICEKKKTFSKGKTHILDIQIMDEAGNSISTERIQFSVQD